MSKKRGLFQKYHVMKLSCPEKKMDCIVMEFDDPTARKGIRAWAKAMINRGYKAAGQEAIDKCEKIDQEQGVWT